MYGNVMKRCAILCEMNLFHTVAVADPGFSPVGLANSQIGIILQIF